AEAANACAAGPSLAAKSLVRADLDVGKGDCAAERVNTPTLGVVAVLPGGALAASRPEATVSLVILDNYVVEDDLAFLGEDSAAQRVADSRLAAVHAVVQGQASLDRKIPEGDLGKGMVNLKSPVDAARVDDRLGGVRDKNATNGAQSFPLDDQVVLLAGD